MSDDETTNHQTISMHPNFPQISRHGARLRKNSKRSKTSCGGSFKPVNQFTSLAYQEYHGESRRYPKRSKDFKMKLRRICFTMERQWQLFDTARAKQHCRWHLEENSCTSLYRVRLKDIPKTNWRWGFFNQKRSRTNKKSGSTKSKWFESMWVCKWNFRNSEATETALQCNQVSVQVLFAISRCDHLQNKPVGGKDAKMQTSEMRLILGIGCIRGHSSCSIGGSVDPVALGRWYSLILETFDICPVAKLKWIHTDCNVLTCTSLAMPSRCFAEWRSGIWRYPGRALHSPSFVGCPSRSRLRCHPPSATRHPWRWNEKHIPLVFLWKASASISFQSFSDLRLLGFSLAASETSIFATIWWSLWLRSSWIGCWLQPASR